MKKKMIEKYFFVLLVINLLLSVFSMSVIGIQTTCKENEKNIFNTTIEEIDQQQPNYNDFYLLYDSVGLDRKAIAQTFVPSFYSLSITKIELCVSKIGEVTSDFTVGIRRVLPGKEWQGRYLTSSMTELFIEYISVPSNEISSSPSWIEFDFDDIQVDRSNNNNFLYQLIIKGFDDNTNKTNCYSIAYSKGSDSYESGKMANIHIGPRITTDGRWCHFFGPYHEDDLAFKIYSTKADEPQVADLVPFIDIIKCGMPGNNLAICTVTNQGSIPAIFDDFQAYAAVTYYDSSTGESFVRNTVSLDGKITEITINPGDEIDVIAELYTVPYLPFEFKKLEVVVDPNNLINEGIGEDNNFASAKSPQKERVFVNTFFQDLLREKPLLFNLLRIIL
jgi:hypothetical protein